jgi:hypothetical protein
MVHQARLDQALTEPPLVVQRAGLVLSVEERRTTTGQRWLRLVMEHTGPMVTDVAILPGRLHLAAGVEVGRLIRVRGPLRYAEDPLAAPGIVAEHLEVLPSLAQVAP